MSGTGKLIGSIAASGRARIDGILHDRAWGDTTLLYSVPASQTEYGPNYGAGEHLGFLQASVQMATVLARSLDQQAGTAADDGFSLEGFTDLNVLLTTTPGAHIRLAQTTSDPFNYGTAWGYYPSSAQTAGDLWTTSARFDYTNPVAGGYAHITLMHEIGHTLGLEHGHENTTFGQLPTSFDSMQHSIMTYRSYVGAVTGRYTNESWGYAQSFMVQDIEALQYMYGADFSTNSGDTVYSWGPTSGQTRVDGEIAISPGANRIFATIWDGGGTDTYDLSAYQDGVQISLKAGGSSVFGSDQLARLGPNIYADGSIFNARLYQGDTRSLIENAIGGNGADTISGNTADNRLEGSKGNDSLSGLGGDDTLLGNYGKDSLYGGSGQDQLAAGNGNDRLHGNNGADTLRGGFGRDKLWGGSGNDQLFGGNDRDTLTGSGGADLLTGGADADVFRFNSVSHSPAGGSIDTILDFEPGVDRIDLSALAPPPFFTFLGEGPFSGTGPSVIQSFAGGETRVLADVDGDGTADLRIDLTGTHNLTATDFIF